MKIKVTCGAYVVSGGVPLYQEAIVESDDGSHLEFKRLQQYETGDTYALCRCGRSTNKPFCDGKHACDPVFEAPETAERSPYSKRAKTFAGNGIELRDDSRCAYARLCHRNGKKIWQIAAEDKPGEFREEEVREAELCPTGRLVAADAATGKEYERDWEPSIVILEDAGLKCGGPIWVRGGIPLVGEDGFEYEARNRYALCRCGYSSNMPFCDATHHHVLFQDGCFEDPPCEYLPGQSGKTGGKA